MAGHCGDCDGCCRVFEVEEVSKPFGQPCQHLGRTLLGPGCQIYNERPEACKHYVCLWLEGERSGRSLGEALRPNVSKVVLGWPWGRDRDTLFVYPYPGHADAWRFPPVSNYLRSVLARGAKLVIVDAKRRIAIRGDMAVIGTEEEFAQLLS